MDFIFTQCNKKVIITLDNVNTRILSLIESNQFLKLETKIEQRIRRFSVKLYIRQLI